MHHENREKKGGAIETMTNARLRIKLVYTGVEIMRRYHVKKIQSYHNESKKVCKTQMRCVEFV